MKRHLFLLILFLIGSIHESMAQREVMYAQYLYNTLEINPAYAGSRHSMAFVSMNRSHWTMVFDRAPMTHSLNLHTPARSEHVGVGLSFRNETVGPEQTTSIYGDYSYRINLTPESTLTFGVKAGVSLFDVPLTQLVIDDPADPAFSSDVISLWLPNFGFGLLYRREQLFVGVSIPKFLEVNYFDNTLVGGLRTILLDRNYYMNAGAVIYLNPEVYLMPSTYIRLQQGSTPEVDLSASLVLFDRFSVGAMVRLQDAMGFNIGLGITENLILGYSFDWAILSRVPSFNFGSHEVVLRYELQFLDSHRERWPRYF